MARYGPRPGRGHLLAGIGLILLNIDNSRIVRLSLSPEPEPKAEAEGKETDAQIRVKFLDLARGSGIERNEISEKRMKKFPAMAIPFLSFFPGGEENDRDRAEFGHSI